LVKGLKLRIRRTLGDEDGTSETSDEDATGYFCNEIGGKHGNNKAFTGFPSASQDCPILRADVHGPNCWNGKDRGNDDSHVLRQGGSIECPKSHPIHIVTQKIESYWDLSQIKGPRKLIWSNGDTTGFGYHADFVNGWDQDVLEAAVESCDIRNGKSNRNCNLPKLEQSKKAQETCAAEYQSSLPGGKGRLVPDEDCTGTIDQLCGSTYGLSVFGGSPSPRQNRKVSTPSTQVSAPPQTSSLSSSNEQEAPSSSNEQKDSSPSNAKTAPSPSNEPTASSQSDTPTAESVPADTVANSQASRREALDFGVAIFIAIKLVL
jgi:hypothetical protein